MSMEIKFKVISPKATLPGYATPFAAGFDLAAAESAFIPPGETRVIGTGLAVELPAGTVGLVCSRSGLAAKESMFVLNAPGVVDEDYRGEIKVILHNASKFTRDVKIGDRIAQMLIKQTLRCYLRVVETLGETVRGESGLGSTGK